MTVTIGVHVREDPEALRATLASLARVSPGVPVVLLPDAPDAMLAQALAALPEYSQCAGDTRGAPAAFNRLLAFNDAAIAVFLESGSIVTQGWLDPLCEALASSSHPGLAGPVTNLAWNSQRMPAAPSAAALLESIADFAGQLAEQRRGRVCRPAPKYSLSDFCFAITRDAADAIGPADEGFGEGPCWEMEYNARAAACGFDGAVVHASYVHRRPIGARRRHAEARLFTASRQRYHARLRALQNTPAPNLPAPIAAPRASAPALAVTNAPTLVSCIMPTRDRRSFVTRAVAQFLEQDYRHRELIVVDDGADSIADVLPADPRIRLIRSEGRLTIGAKRNIACEAARGEIILHWDDDDWMARWRVRYQVEELSRHAADVCGLSSLYFYDPAAARAWRYTYAERRRPWLAGGTLCYRASLWRGQRFAEVNEGEDTRFVWALRGARFLALPDPAFYVATVHPGNTSRKRTTDARYEPCPVETVERIISAPALPRVSCIMPTGNRRRFVALACEYFLRQDYPNRELVVVDDGRDRVGDLVPSDPRVRYIARAPARLGVKRNEAVREASGEYIAHWDDDDWYGAGRLSAQMAPLIAGEADASTLTMRHVLALPSLEFWRCEAALHARLHYRDLCCGTMVYPRTLWERHGPYPPLNVAEDVRFLQRLARGGARVHRLDVPGLFVCVRHGRNTWRIARDWTTHSGGWTAVEPPPFIGDRDMRTYRELAGALREASGRPAA